MNSNFNQENFFKFSKSIRGSQGETSNSEKLYGGSTTYFSPLKFKYQKGTESQDVSFISESSDIYTYSIYSEQKDELYVKEFWMTSKALEFINNSSILKEAFQRTTGYLYDFLENLNSGYIVLFDTFQNDLTNKEELKMSVFVRHKSIGQVIDLRNDLNNLFFGSLDKKFSKEESLEINKSLFLDFESIF